MKVALALPVFRPVRLKEDNVLSNVLELLTSRTEFKKVNRGVSEEAR